MSTPLPAHDSRFPPSNAAGRRAGADLRRLLRIYNAYRIVVSLALLGAGLAHAQGLIELYGSDPAVTWIAAGWLATAIALMRFNARLATTQDKGPVAVVLFDIVVTAFLVRFSSELNTSLPLLYLVTSAAAAVLIANRMTATGMAALAVLALLSDSAFQLQQGAIGTKALLSAGLLGALIFLISLLLQQIVARMAVIEEMADVATTQVATLEEFNEQVIAHMTTGVCRISEDNCLTPINAAAKRLLEIDPGTSSVAIASLSAILADYVEQWRRGHSADARPFRLRTGGKPLLPEIVSIGHDFEPEVLLFIEDFTPATETAQSLKLTALGKLTASIAHEIRNPLAAISHASQLMRESVSDSPEQVALQDIIVNNTQRVNEIIENVMQLSRREPPTPEVLDTLPWLRLFIEEYEQGQTDGGHVVLQPAASLGMIAFDPGNLRRILSNLLDNGIRHGGAAAGDYTATLAVTRDEETRKVYMDVIDTGTGVPEEMRERLFEPFFTTSAQGSGLGLYLCRELSESNGARLSYGETPEGLTRFRLAIPLGERAS